LLEELALGRLREAVELQRVLANVTSRPSFAFFWARSVARSR
jgi:hypothetical protein